MPLPFVRGNPPVTGWNKGPVTRRMFSIDDVIMTPHQTPSTLYMTFMWITENLEWSLFNIVVTMAPPNVVIITPGVRSDNKFVTMTTICHCFWMIIVRLFSSLLYTTGLGRRFCSCCLYQESYIDSRNIFTHFLQGCFTGTGAIIWILGFQSWLYQYYWNNLTLISAWQLGANSVISYWWVHSWIDRHVAFPMSFCYVYFGRLNAGCSHTLPSSLSYKLCVVLNNITVNTILTGSKMDSNLAKIHTDVIIRHWSWVMQV